MRYVTNTAPTKLVPAPNAHKMIQRMAIQRQQIQSKTQLKAQASSFIETKQDHWIEDIGDRVDHKLEYSSLFEEEGVANRIDFTDNRNTKEVLIKTIHHVPESSWRNDIYKMPDDNYGPKPS